MDVEKLKEAITAAFNKEPSEEEKKNLPSSDTFFSGRNISLDEMPDDIKQEVADSLDGMKKYVEEIENED